MHYHYLTLEQRSALEQVIRSRGGTPAELRAALARLHAPDFGLCVSCGKDIAFVRLRADLDATHCSACARLPTPAARA